MYFTTPAQTVSTLFALAACGYAIWRGGGPERLAAAAILADWLVTPWLEGPDAYHSLQFAIFGLDSATAAILLAIALTADRFWPLLVVALQILELLMLGAMALDRHVHARAYFVGMEIASYLMLIALAAGVWAEAPRGRLSPRRVSGA